MVISSKSISRWWASSNELSKYWIRSRLSLSTFFSRFTWSTCFRSALRAFFAPASSSGGNSKSFSPRSILLSISWTARASSSVMFSARASSFKSICFHPLLALHAKIFFRADSMFVRVQKVNEHKPNFKYLSICFFSGRGEFFPSPRRLSCDNLGVEDLALLNGLAYSAITNKNAHKACHTLVGHRRFVRAIIFRNKGQFFKQIGHAVDPILFHLVICLVGKFQLFGVYLRRAILILVALGNGSKKRFKLFADFISHRFAIQDNGKSVRISHLVLLHSINSFLAVGRNPYLFCVPSLGTIILYHKLLCLSIPFGKFIQENFLRR